MTSDFPNELSDEELDHSFKAESADDSLNVSSKEIVAFYKNFFFIIRVVIFYFMVDRMMIIISFQS